MKDNKLVTDRFNSPDINGLWMKLSYDDNEHDIWGTRKTPASGAPKKRLIRVGRECGNANWPIGRRFKWKVLNASDGEGPIALHYRICSREPKLRTKRDDLPKLELIFCEDPLQLIWLIFGNPNINIIICCVLRVWNGLSSSPELHSLLRLS